MARRVGSARAAKVASSWLVIVSIKRGARETSTIWLNNVSALGERMDNQSAALSIVMKYMSYKGFHPSLDSLPIAS